MSAVRVMGAETEYGIHAPTQPGANATWLSAQVVNAYAHTTGQRSAGGGEARWDYSDEDPLADARGWRVPRHAAHPSQLTDAPRFSEPAALTAAQIAQEDAAVDSPDAEDQDADPSTLMMNLVLGNGARLYVDHAHPEYSSPEVTNPRDAVIWDAAGDQVALAAVRWIEQNPALPQMNLYKNNTDNKAVSYGSHENYLMPRSVPFGHIVAGLTPFFVTRPVVCGAGRVGLGQDGSGAGFQLSARADFFETEVGLETTIRRPIINTRDEPHATADKYRRLHVIVGDANLSQSANYLKFGTTALVLDLIERGLAPAVEIHEPVKALHTVSHDVSVTQKLRLTDGRRLTALEVQWLYFEAAAQQARRSGVDSASGGDGHTAGVLQAWEQALTGLARGVDQVSRTVEWAAKLSLIQQYRNRDSLTWTDPRVGLIDLQWSDVRPEKGLYYRLLQKNRMDTVVSEAEIAAAVGNPPTDTRAYFRGRAVSQFGPHVAGASWDSVIFEVPRHRRLRRVTTREPLRGTRALTGELFDRHQDVESFLEELLGSPS